MKTETELRLECLELAIRSSLPQPTEVILTRAKAFEQYVIGPPAVARLDQLPDFPFRPLPQSPMVVPTDDGRRVTGKANIAGYNRTTGPEGSEKAKNLSDAINKNLYPHPGARDEAVDRLTD